ncbi:hypothetical protein [Streptomyces atroolivaceus]|uniref:hypothetical protein n=1 Tax=Streptomyces atroolivaceus TaxID=66869 RepID=UPI00379B35C7
MSPDGTLAYVANNGSATLDVLQVATTTITNGAGAHKTVRVPLHLLALGQVEVTGPRTVSAPTDPNSADDTATATCTAISIILVTCPDPSGARPHATHHRCPPPTPTGRRRAAA